MAPQKKQSKSLRIEHESQLRKRADLVAVDGALYDLVGLAQVHPGGSMILSAGASDASALFHSMHPGVDPQKSQLLIRFYKGEYTESDAQYTPKYDYNSDFAIDLKKRVREVMKRRQWYAPLGFWVRCLLIMAGTVACEYMWASTGVMLWGVWVGILHGMIGLSIQHDASHGAVSKSPSVNALLAYGADWIGNSRWIWLQQHILWHHPHTNNLKLDGDTTSAEPALLFHDYKDSGSARQLFHRFQHWFMHIVLAFYGPSIVWNISYLTNLRHNYNMPSSLFSPTGFFTRRKPSTVMLRLLYIGRVVLAPWVIGGASLITCLLLVPTVCGILLTFVFVVSHNFVGSNREPGAGSSLDWYKLQVETSCTYGGTVGMLLTGGLNLQIEHHLFPRMCSWWYPLIQPTVQQCCEKHGVKYTYFGTIWTNLASTLRYMKHTGAAHVLKHAQQEF